MFGKTNFVAKVTPEGVSYLSPSFNLSGTWTSRKDYEGEYVWEKSLRIMPVENGKEYINVMVTFDEESACSGNFSPICRFYMLRSDDGLYWAVSIFAKEKATKGTCLVTFIA